MLIFSVPATSPDLAGYIPLSDTLACQGEIVVGSGDPTSTNSSSLRGVHLDQEAVHSYQVKGLLRSPASGGIARKDGIQCNTVYPLSLFCYHLLRIKFYRDDLGNARFFHSYSIKHVCRFHSEFVMGYDNELRFLAEVFYQLYEAG